MKRFRDELASSQLPLPDSACRLRLREGLAWRTLEACGVLRPCLLVRSASSGNLIGRDLGFSPQSGGRRGTWRHVHRLWSVLHGPERRSGSLGQLTVARHRRDNPSLAAPKHGRAPLSGLSDARQRLSSNMGCQGLGLPVSVAPSYTNALLPSLLAPFSRSLRKGSPRYREVEISGGIAHRLVD
jgi:hypothetical protein